MVPQLCHYFSPSCGCLLSKLRIVHALCSVPFPFPVPPPSSLSLSLTHTYHISHTISCIQGFYHLCLDTTSWNKSGTEACIPENIGIANDSNPDIISCSGYVCSGSVPTPNLSYVSCCTSQCFQPYTFICQLPLKILWYIIYWLFFALSW